ncbi:helix-turn-helix transcriptional regulator [Micromonospora sp. AKA38]|uniref:helix-turn-helix transcriptional regulator n=1 Tax=Micromonospora sp. AKA38 TaxID=2733861 RepID=UPI0022BF5214|nr:LuxR C-terminal-related transcriptional regulator [Micromonospora sp. AKA38]GHJ16943.1 hypothetical protein TPA0908_49380 [Micromonospora sp. AKA38]
MTVDPADHRLRRARRITLLSLGTNGWTTVLLPAVGLLREPDPVRAVLGVVGLLGFTAAQVAVLHAAVTPWLATPARRRRHLALAVVALLSLPLVGPVAAGAWPTWAWLGASLVGMTPLLFRPAVAVAAAVGVLTAAAGVTVATGGPLPTALLVTGGVGAGIALLTWVQVWFWDLLVEARQGQAAGARLPRELETLRLAELGTPVAVIARRTHLAAGTVRNHLSACVQKLGAADRAEAVRRAREAGWL